MGKMINHRRRVLCAILMLQVGLSVGRALNEEDIASLLPATPQTTNETVAAIVQDPVVKDAIQYAVGNGSLSGLVVKKNVVIMPVNAPDTILSHRQQILVPPVTHLEAIRKNVTEDLQAEGDPQNSDESGESHYIYNSSIEDDRKDSSIQEDESSPSYDLPNISVSSEESSESSTNPRNSTAYDVIYGMEVPSELPEGVVAQKIRLPEEIENRVDVPVVAVLDTSENVNDKVEGTLVALLPMGQTDDDSHEGVDYLKSKSQEIKMEAQDLVDQTSMTVDPESGTVFLMLNAERTSPSSPNEAIDRESVRRDSNVDYVIPERISPATVVVVSPLEIVTSVSEPTSGRIDYSNNDEDMDVAEDIVFRPLFRFRQEAQRRSKYREGEAYRRSSYQRYDPYGRYNPYKSYGGSSYRYRPRSYQDDDDY